MALRRNRSVYKPNLTWDDGKSYPIITNPVGKYIQKSTNACQAYNLDTIGLITIYKRHQLKIMTAKANIWFNKQCLALGVTPKFARIQIKSNTTSSRKTTKRAEKDFIKFEIQSLYAKKEKTNAQLLNIHLKLAERLPTSVLLDVLDQARTENVMTMKTKYKTLDRKLERLTGSNDNKKTNGERNFHPRVVNLAGVTINKQEAELLQKGLKHNIAESNKKKEIEQTIVDTEVAITMLPNEEQEQARHTCKRIIELEVKNKKTQKAEHKTVKELKQKLQANNILITKADKGNTTVLIDKHEYITKTEQLIEDMKCRKIRKDPTEEYQKNIKEAVKRATKIIGPDMTQSLTLMNPSAPSMIALPKIHKENIPMRPIINYKSAPSYKLSKYLRTILKDKLDLTHKHTIANTEELIEKMKTVRITENSRLVSFDIKDLYPSIPIAETVKIMHRTLIEKTRDVELTTQLTNTLKTTLEQNYFKFNNNIYRQTNGLGMGNPTSAILMEVFMQNLEEEYIEELKNNYGVTFYARYVDDIICILEKDNKEQVLDFLNEGHKNIKFTMEGEEDGKINYLDLTIKRNELLKTIEYEIYRKPTATDTIIHNSSNHPQQHKNAAIRHLVMRLERTPLTREMYKKEMETIYTIARNNGYKRQLVDSIKTQIRADKDRNKAQEQVKEKWATLTYMGKSTYKLAKFFKKHNIAIAFRTRNNLGRILQNNTNESSPLDKQGVYKLTCTCQHSYIGQTGRKIKTRFREHMRDYNKKLREPTATPESNYANHIFNNKCIPGHVKNTVELLHTQHKGRRLNVLENMEIYKQKTFDGRIINEQINTASDTIFEPLKYFYRKENNTTSKPNNDYEHAQNEKSIESPIRRITDYYDPIDTHTRITQTHDRIDTQTS